MWSLYLGKLSQVLLPSLQNNVLGFQDLAFETHFCLFQGIKGPKGVVDMMVSEDFFFHIPQLYKLQGCTLGTVDGLFGKER